MNLFSQKNQPDLLLYLGEEQAQLYQYEENTIHLLQTVATSAPNRLILPHSKNENCPLSLSIVTNLSSETYEIHALPLLKSRDMSLFIKQKLQKIFIKQSYSLAFNLDTPTKKQENKVNPTKNYLLASLMAEELIVKWMNFFDENNIVLMGVHTLSLWITEHFISDLKQKEQASICYLTPDHFFNFIYIQKGKLYFSRKIPFNLENQDLNQELDKTLSFMINHHGHLRIDITHDLPLFIFDTTLIQIQKEDNLTEKISHYSLDLKRIFTFFKVKKPEHQFAPANALQRQFAQKMKQRSKQGLLFGCSFFVLCNLGLFWLWHTQKNEFFVLEKSFQQKEQDLNITRENNMIPPEQNNPHLLIHQIQLFKQVEEFQKKFFKNFELLYRFSQIFGDFSSQASIRKLEWERPTPRIPQSFLRITAVRLQPAPTIEMETQAILSFIAHFEQAARKDHLLIHTEKLPLALQSSLEIKKDPVINTTKSQKKNYFTVRLTNE